MCKGLIYLNNRFQNIHDHVNDTVWKRTLVPPQLPTTAIHGQQTPTSIHPTIQQLPVPNTVESSAKVLWLSEPFLENLLLLPQKRVHVNFN